MKRHVLFRTTMFREVIGEENETNPECISKELAEWLFQKLPQNGISVLEIIPEDWGRCILVSRKPYLLWIGCNTYGENQWLCFVVAELGLFQKWVKKIDTTSDVSRVCNVLQEIFAGEQRITDIHWMDESEI